MAIGPELWPNAKLIIFWCGVALCAVGASGFIWASIASRLASRADSQAKTPKSSGPSVTSHNQSGGTTAFNVTVSAKDDLGKRE